MRGLVHDVAAVGVIIPAHDEEDLLPSCLAAVRVATAPLAGIPVHVVVVADACTDQTAGLARAGGAAVLAIEARDVGTARAAGVAEVLRRTGPVDPATVWLATTDADTLVPPGWLAQQLRYAEDGWDAVVGTITVNDWQQYPAEVPPLFQQLYETGSPAGDAAHPHVHGANLGFSAAAYLAAGGFGPARTAEDHALVNALAAAGRRVLRTTTVSVVTSARRHARAPHGFSQLLGSLAASAEA